MSTKERSFTTLAALKLLVIGFFLVFFTLLLTYFGIWN